jgi:hypothetical protein
MWIFLYVLNYMSIIRNFIEKTRVSHVEMELKSLIANWDSVAVFFLLMSLDESVIFF